MRLPLKPLECDVRDGVTLKAKQVSQAASLLSFPELEFGVANNGTYPSEDFQRVLARITFADEFADTSVRAYQLACGDVVDVGTGSRNPLAKARCIISKLDADAVHTKSFQGGSRE